MAKDARTRARAILVFQCRQSLSFARPIGPQLAECQRFGGTAPHAEEPVCKTFKSLADVTVELGLVNVFVGANGSGKSNLLEALGVLSAAADGKVDDQSLLARGVRPGVPRVYKSAFPAKPDTRIPPHISFGAQAPAAYYRVTLHNPPHSHQQQHHPIP